MKTEGFTDIKKPVIVKIAVIAFIILSSITLKAYETRAEVSLGGGWKSDVDPAFSFRSPSDIFNRYSAKSSATMIFSADAGMQSEKESGFVVDLSISGMLSLQYVRNSTLNSGIDGGYIYTLNENNIFAFIAGIHNSAYDYISLKSLFVDPRFSFSYLYDPASFYALFFRAGFSYYISTSSIVEYLTGPSLFLEGGVRFNFNDYGSLDWFAGSSFTFFNDQRIRYNRYQDVYYGELDIAGKYYSLYTGLSYLWSKSFFSVPLSLRYIFSRSFDNDTHKIVYWGDVGIPSRIYEKERIDSTLEFSAGVGFDVFDNFSIRADYFLHKTFSNVGDDFGDYADYDRLAHTFSAEICYEY